MEKYDFQLWFDEICRVNDEVESHWRELDPQQQQKLQTALQERWEGKIQPKSEGVFEIGNQRLASILASIQDVFYTVDANFCFTYVNQAAADAWGKQVEDLLGKKLWDIFPQTVETFPQQKLLDAMRNRQSLRFETLSPILKKWIDVRVTPTPDGGLSVYFRDIDDRKRAEQALQFSEERFTKAFGLSPVALVISHKNDGHIQEANESFLELFGYQREEVIGKTSLELGLYAHPADRQELLNRLNGGKNFTPMEVEVCTHSGERRQALLSSVSISTEYEDYLLTIIQDITERNRMLEASRIQSSHLEVQRRLLEQREQERLQIARDLHDGPIQDLTAITFSLEGLAMQYETDPQLANELRSLRKTVQDNIAVMRSYAGELRPPALTNFGLEKAIHSHLGEFAARHPELALHFRPHQETGEIPQEVRLALYRIYQAAINNVAKHAQATDVTVRLKQTREQVVLEVSDNGTGFAVPDDWLSLARHGHLGLVGMRERAEVIGGEMQVISRRKRGTKIRVQVPL